MKEEPFIALGIAGTIGALLFATRGVIKDNIHQAQWGYRGRVVMQGLTLAIVAGYGLFKVNDSTKRERIADIRPIDWDKLEREAQEAEESRKRGSTPALDKLTRIAEERRARSVFAKEEGEPKK
ncbi:hypothetical protein GGF46_004704 [Coemansia sp. RSA 552]|nr:hypothetical protein GGF46_004704 [Coemansia sp. RSA 552]